MLTSLLPPTAGPAIVAGRSVTEDPAGGPQADRVRRPGQRRRLDIAMGLMRMRADHGTTIVLTTHYLEEADAIAERIVVIDNGLVIADETGANLKANLAGDRRAGNC